MAVSVYTSLSYICETRPRGEKNQGVEFEPIEAGYHPVLFICVHRSQWHVSNKLSEINFQFNIAPSRLWRSVWSVYHELVDPITVLSSNIPRPKNLGTVVAPQGDHGASECEAGVGLWDLNGVNDVRAPLELRASLILGAPFALHALQASFTSFPSDGLGVSKIGHF